MGTTIYIVLATGQSISSPTFIHMVKQSQPVRRFIVRSQEPEKLAIQIPDVRCIIQTRSVEEVVAWTELREIDLHFFFSNIRGEFID